MDRCGDRYRRYGIRVRKDRRFGIGVIRQRSLTQMWNRYWKKYADVEILPVLNRFGRV